MDGRNCSGRKISLLNDSGDVAAAPSKIQLQSLSVHSRASSSCASTPSLSPQTPQLVRSSSSDSRTFASPSPLTPSLNAFDSHYHAHRQQPQQQHYHIYSQSYAKMDDPNASMYPPIPDATGAMPQAYPMPQMQPMPPQGNQHQVYRASNSPASEPSRVSTVSATSNSKSQPKKNQYPCPMAKQFGCTDFFTTSGHAARHAKKHTGKKDAFCPECNKAFTRKDNMEQHRRTHQTGRGGSRTSNGDESSKVKKSTKTPSKKNVVKAEPQQLEAAVQQELIDQPQPVQAPLPPQVIQAVQAQVMAQQQQLAQEVAVQQAMSLPATGPYFVNAIDTGPIPPLPNVMPELNMRPGLQRSNFATSLDYIPPIQSMAITDADGLHYSYPSPGLSNGLNSLALAASEHRRRLSEEKSQSQSPQETPLRESP